VRLLMTAVWSTRWKAFEKSTNVTLASWDWARALCQMCNISTRAWVVDRPLIAPNCLISSVGNMQFIIQLPEYDSNILDKVDVKEIGRKSDSILPGCWTLGMGITLACFHSCGKISLLRDVLKIQRTVMPCIPKSPVKTNFGFDQDLVTCKHWYWPTCILHYMVL